LNTLSIIVRLVLAVVLGGLVGQERENKNRPAGFRTHILVCTGSALVMITSEFLFNKYIEFTNMDPARLGAQVISGIGFLGAGTIIRQGSSVKGLTTAASLWAVACVGLAAGAGFYEGAIAGAIIIYLTFLLMGRFGKAIERKGSHLTVCLDVEDKPGKIGEIGLALGKYDVSVRNIEFIDEDEIEENLVTIRLSLKLPTGVTHDMVLDAIRLIDGVHNVESM